MDQLFCMRVFTRVAELGSFARASEDLGIGRSAATQALGRLEKHLGVRLLHRTTRTLSLTEDGHTFYQSCVRILGELAETEDSLSRARVSPRGRLRVSTPHSFVHLHFFPELPRFLARHAELEVEVFLTDRAVDLVEEGIDCAVRAVEIRPDAPLIARRISTVRWITCASPAYLAARGAPARIADLEAHNCIRFISQSTGRTVDWRFEEGGEARSLEPRGNLGVTSLEAAAFAAQRGVGIAQIPDALALPGIRAGELRPLLLECAAFAPPLHLVYPSNRYLSAKVRAFGDFVAEIFPADGWWGEIAASLSKGARPL